MSVSPCFEGQAGILTIPWSWNVHSSDVFQCDEKDGTCDEIRASIKMLEPIYGAGPLAKYALDVGACPSSLAVTSTLTFLNLDALRRERLVRPISESTRPGKRHSQGNSVPRVDIRLAGPLLSLRGESFSQSERRCHHSLALGFCSQSNMITQISTPPWYSSPVTQRRHRMAR